MADQLRAQVAAGFGGCEDTDFDQGSIRPRQADVASSPRCSTARSRTVSSSQHALKSRSCILSGVASPARSRGPAGHAGWPGRPVIGHERAGDAAWFDAGHHHVEGRLPFVRVYAGVCGHHVTLGRFTDIRDQPGDGTYSPRLSPARSRTTPGAAVRHELRDGCRAQSRLTLTLSRTLGTLPSLSSLHSLEREPQRVLVPTRFRRH